MVICLLVVVNKCDINHVHVINGTTLETASVAPFLPCLDRTLVLDFCNSRDLSQEDC